MGKAFCAASLRMDKRRAFEALSFSGARRETVEKCCYFRAFSGGESIDMGWLRRAH
jgi:hypothetical protein